MTHKAQDQIDLDISAFVNGQLDAEARFAVVEYLAQNPDRAAAVMDDLRLNEGLRLAFGQLESPAPPALQSAAGHLSRGLAERGKWRVFLPFAAAVALFASGWAAQSIMTTGGQRAVLASNERLIEAALDAQEAVGLRLALTPEIGPMPRDAAEIAERLGIDLPDLPKSWVLVAAQVVATPERPGLVLVLNTPDMGEIMLFTVKRSTDGPDGPADTLVRGGRSLAFFEEENAAYVLVDKSGPVSELKRGAEQLRSRFN